MLHLELSEQMAMTIIDALADYKFRLAAPVIGEIQRQISAQRMPMPGNGKAVEDTVAQ